MSTPSNTAGDVLPATLDWEQLVASARDGDNEALGHLCDRVRGFLHLMVRGELADDIQGKLDASDVIQDTMLEACRDFRHFKGKSEQEFRAWTARLVHHNLIDSVRKFRQTESRDSSRELSLDSNSVHQMPSQSAQTASSMARRREVDEELLRAVANLPEKPRTVIELRHRHGLSHGEIADELGISEASVRQVWSRSIKLLRRQLTSSDARPTKPR